MCIWISASAALCMPSASHVHGNNNSTVLNVAFSLSMHDLNHKCYMKSANLCVICNVTIIIALIKLLKCTWPSATQPRTVVHTNKSLHKWASGCATANSIIETNSIGCGDVPRTPYTPPPASQRHNVIVTANTFGIPHHTLFYIAYNMDSLILLHKFIILMDCIRLFSHLAWLSWARSTFISTQRLPNDFGCAVDIESVIIPTMDTMVERTINHVGQDRWDNGIRRWDCRKTLWFSFIVALIHRDIGIESWCVSPALTATTMHHLYFVFVLQFEHLANVCAGFPANSALHLRQCEGAQQAKRVREKESEKQNNNK